MGLEREGLCTLDRYSPIHLHGIRDPTVLIPPRIVTLEPPNRRVENSYLRNRQPTLSTNPIPAEVCTGCINPCAAEMSATAVKDCQKIVTPTMGTEINVECAINPQLIFGDDKIVQSQVSYSPDVSEEATSSLTNSSEALSQEPLEEDKVLTTLTPAQKPSQTE